MIERKQIVVNNKLKKVLFGISVASAALSIVSISISFYLNSKKNYGRNQ